MVRPFENTTDLSPLVFCLPACWPASQPASQRRSNGKQLITEKEFLRIPTTWMDGANRSKEEQQATSGERASERARRTRGVQRPPQCRGLRARESVGGACGDASALDERELEGRVNRGRVVGRVCATRSQPEASHMASQPASSTSAGATRWRVVCGRCVYVFAFCAAARRAVP